MANPFSNETLSLVLRDVRTFVGSHTVPLRPLTILIGENSSGKTTLLAALNAVSDFRFPFQPAFNQFPFSLGGFDTIATNKGRGAERKDEFGLGFSYQNADESRPHEYPSRLSRSVHATYKRWHGQPRLAALKLTARESTLNVDLNSSDDRAIGVRLRLDRAGERIATSYAVEMPLARLETIDLFMLTHGNADDSGSEIRRAFSSEFGFDAERAPFRTIALAPIRTRPQRAYSETTEAFEPSGEHVPFLLRRFLLDQPNSEETKQVVNAIREFGVDSGLLDRVQVRQPGKKPEDPFQLVVLLDKKPRNIVDVGYGVSQALPLVVETAVASDRAILLIQQPEVHLHPRGQAALGSFFVRAVAELNKRIVVETHSDYLVDRVRQAVAMRILAKEEVSLLFFERRGVATKIHALDMDNEGNISKAPPAYRAFFLQEATRTLLRSR
jgi:energy-coupling factor transporter ATP-binding protein EcfA2